ncbi:MAG: NifB/NifX family molybdenum-iron cluster-binding protein [Candidatus Odinarchaeota archaeon]|nr:NifB/NifX family molybdenum-iron cluster-binding protein [Candidatus Odinarchaeota archaeon]
MKIAISTPAPGGLDVPVNPQFGRTPTFTFVEVDSGGNIVNVYVVDNPGAQAMHGAGPLAVQVVAKEGVNAIITGALGPNASQAVAALGVPAYVAPPNVTVRQAVQMLLSNSLSPITAATGPGYGGRGRGGGMGYGRGGGRGMGRGGGMGRGRGGGW